MCIYSPTLVFTRLIRGEQDGKVELVQAASVSVHGPHGQYVENIHLKPFKSNDEFWEELYAGPYARLLQKARDFLDETGGSGDDVLVFIRYVAASSIL